MLIARVVAACGRLTSWWAWEWTERLLATIRGWRAALRAAAWTLIPGMAIVRARHSRSSGEDGLTAVRAQFVTFAVSLGLIGIVVGLLADGGTRSSMSGQSGALLVTAVGAVTVLLARFVPRPLNCHSDASLAGSYRSRFFLAFAQGAALCGFVAFFLTANPAMYPLALIFSAAGYVSLAPTAARLDADQQALGIGGCGRSLVLALRFGGTDRT
ncbi:MAG: hypothetical protein ACRDZN_15635 [Acidimicrobiales bacterium]